MYATPYVPIKFHDSVGQLSDHNPRPMAKVKLLDSNLDLDSHEKGGHTIAKHIITPDKLLANQNYF